MYVSPRGTHRALPSAKQTLIPFPCRAIIHRNCCGLEAPVLMGGSGAPLIEPASYASGFPPSVQMQSKNIGTSDAGFRYPISLPPQAPGQPLFGYGM